MPRPLRVGIQLPEVEREVRWPEYVRLAKAAEAAGFDSIWIGDHLLYRGDGRPERGPFECFTLLAGLAAATERVRLGPLVACTAFRPPAVLAKMAAGVDEISGGRLVLGIGAGWNEPEFNAFGLPFDNRVSRFEEAFEILRRLLAGERVSYEGRFSRVEDAVLLPRPERAPPIMLGSMGRRMLGIALPHAAAWNAWYEDYGNTAAGFGALNERISVIAAELGRQPGEIDRSACVLVVLDHSVGERPVTESAPPLSGSMAEIVDGLREMSLAGADEVILVVDPITQASIEALAEALTLLDS